MKTASAEAQAAAATSNEEVWRNQASQAKALAMQKETEYDTIVACRKVDYDRHQGGLEKIKSGFDTLLRRQEDDLEKQKKLEIIAEQQRQTIAQLEEYTRKLTSNFKAYRLEIDNAVSGLRQSASHNDQAVADKLEEMNEVTGRMRWVMNIETVFNPSHSEPAPRQVEDTRNGHASRPQSTNEDTGKRTRSPSKLTKHRRKDSAKVTK